MNILQAIRHWQHRSVGRMCAVFVAVWINLAFQACAMAAMPDEGCPHCPPGMHDSEMPMARIDPMGPTAPMNPIAPSVPMDCGVIDAIDDPDLVGPSTPADGGTGGVESAVLQTWSGAPVLRSPDVRLHRYKSVRSAHGPPLNVLYCVYLK